MYEQYYELDRLPFEATADPSFFFASEQHREALASIEYTIRLRKGITLITGNIGSGKTTVGRVVCQNCQRQATIIQIIPRCCNGMALLQQVLRHVRLPVRPGDDYATLTQRLTVYLTNRAHQDKPVVLLVDEAQSLGDDALEELRVLSNLNSPGVKMIQVVLIGQPELRTRIRRPEYDALRQRIVLAKELRPLNNQETAEYITHRLRAASLDPSDPKATFSEGAVREIHRISQGLPRLINTICDNCLLLGFARQTHQITPDMVHRVSEDMVPRFDNAAESGNDPQSNLSLAGNF